MMIPIDGGKFHVRTDRVGSGPVKMLTLHGGPGFRELLRFVKDVEAATFRKK
jgi:hypothetical protein